MTAAHAHLPMAFMLGPLPAVTLAPRPTPGVEGDCWLTKYVCGPNGYVTLQKKRDGRRYRSSAMRVFYWRLVGPIPEDEEPDHLCRNRPCCNPHHAELVTHQVNVRRGSGPVADRARQTHCKRGHSLGVDGDVRIAKNGTRHCLACTRRPA